MTDDVPAEWEADQRRTYTPAEEDRPKEYVTFVHESGDLRLRIAPASMDDDDLPGYAITATTYPGLEFSESVQVRRVLRFERCRSLAVRFMELFSATYDGPADFEDALEYAAERVRAPDASDVVFDVEHPDASEGEESDDVSGTPTE